MATIKLVSGLDALTSQLQTNIAQALRPLLNNLLLNGRVLEQVTLAIGTNVVPTGLGRPVLGWVITRKRSAANIYDSQDSNTTPALNLLLVSDAVATVDIYVF